MSASPDELARRLDALGRDIDHGFTSVKAKQDYTNGRVRDLELSQARQEGATKALMWVVSLGLGLPTTILGIIALVTLRGG